MTRSVKWSPILDYIDRYWDQITFFQPRDRLLDFSSLLNIFGRVGLPNRGVSANDTYGKGSQFYWDSYFTILGLVSSGRIELAKDVADNLVYLFEKFHLIPARNSLTSIGRSQPPLLTSMAGEIYDHDPHKDREWLEAVLRVAAREYETVWNSGQRYVEKYQLSRYYPKFFPNSFVHYESGWDLSSRFAGVGAALLPIDLNCLLYKYEIDLAKFSHLTGDAAGEKKWLKRAQARRKSINSHLWDGREGLYFDLNLKTGQKTPLKTLAGFFALWSGVASEEQAQLMVGHLKDFETDFGLTATAAVPWRRRQWDYPNGWPNLVYITVAGLRNYGFREEADRITGKWLDLNLKVFQETGRLWEKYDVVNGKVGLSGLYPTQSGFGWTNSVFLRLSKDVVLT